MKHVLKNLKTTLFGSIAGLSILGDGIAQKDWAMIIGGIATLLTGLFAKDHDTH